MNSNLIYLTKNIIKLQNILYKQISFDLSLIIDTCNLYIWSKVIWQQSLSNRFKSVNHLYYA